MIGYVSGRLSSHVSCAQSSPPGQGWTANSFNLLQDCRNSVKDETRPMKYKHIQSHTYYVYMVLSLSALLLC